MIQYRTGDILLADTEALVNPVNCVGVAGRGLALQFRRAWPQSFLAYRAACQRGELRPGTVFVFELPPGSGPRYIVHLPTKRYWRDRSTLEDVEAGLLALAREIRRRGIRSVAVPALGCGLGGLRWDQVLPLIERILGQLDGVLIAVYPPAGVS